jgi:hypothetical protein
MKNVYVSFPQMGVSGPEADFLEPIAEALADAVAERSFTMFFRDRVGAVRVLLEDADNRDDAALAVATGVNAITGGTSFKAVEIDSTGTRTELTDPVVP